jgi:YebC/PmpR family DNA-binding regulatory protein
MSGHSKWAGIKHKKAIIDKKRGKLWTKVVREITMAAKLHGGKEDANPRLRKAIQDAKAANMPAENIKRAIQKGTGELPGLTLEELTFEGYGPGGVAVYCTGTTDNRNRTTNEVRKIYENNGGNMGTAGAVAYLFVPKGYITVAKSAMDEDALLELVLDLGAEDLKTADKDLYEVITEPAQFDAVREGLEAKKVSLESAELTRIPTTTVPIDGEKAAQLVAMIEELEDYDDIADVYSNFDMSDEVLASLEK